MPLSSVGTANLILARPLVMRMRPTGHTLRKRRLNHKRIVSLRLRLPCLVQHCPW